jgi:hypothetical protein
VWSSQKTAGKTEARQGKDSSASVYELMTTNHLEVQVIRGYMRNFYGMHEKNLLTSRYCQGYIGQIFFNPLIYLSCEVMNARHSLYVGASDLVGIAPMAGHSN